MYQDEQFKQRRDKLKTVISFQAVFENKQVRKKLYGLKVNGKQDLALTDREKEMVRAELEEVETIVREFKKGL